MKFKKGIIYILIANLINIVIGLFTGFVLPMLLSIETYASIKLFQLYITYAGFFHFGYADGIYLKYGGKDIKDIDKKEVLEEFNTFKLFQLFVTFSFIIISFIIKNNMLFLCSLVLFPINIGDYLRNFYQAIGEFKRYSRFTNVNTILIFLANLFLLLIIKTDYNFAYIGAYIIAYYIYCAFLEFENRKIFKKSTSIVNSEFIVSNIKSGFLLMLGNFGSVIFTNIDRLFVQYLFGSIKFAIYSFATNVENVLNAFITPISTVMYNYLCNNKERKMIISLKRIILIVSAYMLFIAFIVKFFVIQFIPKYFDSLNVIFIILSAQYISIIIRCINLNIYKSEKKQKIYFYNIFFVIVISILLNFLFNGIYSSIEMIAIATLISNIIWFIISEIDLKKYRLEYKDYMYSFFVIIIFLVNGIYTNKIQFSILYLLVLTVFSVIFESETVKFILTDIKKRIKKEH